MLETLGTPNSSPGSQEVKLPRDLVLRRLSHLNLPRDLISRRLSCLSLPGDQHPDPGILGSHVATVVGRISFRKIHP